MSDAVLNLKHAKEEWMMLTMVVQRRQGATGSASWREFRIQESRNLAQKLGAPGGWAGGGQ